MSMTSPATAQTRCRWAGSEPRMCAYHDEEWGVPERDARALWEKLMLDGFQAGLSWSTILHKRDAFRRAFVDFDPQVIATWGERDIDRLMADAGIVRARKKIEATIRGATIFCEMQARGEDFADFCWSFTDGEVVLGDGVALTTQSPLSVTIATELRVRGFSFCGPVIVYAWLQAVGIVNDHSLECFRRTDLARRS
jgi:DNA-3-methyladenine glycosylase I